MHILVTNDDGPPSNQSSPYVHSLVSTLKDAGHTVSVVLPNAQRSWIGKAHMVGQTLTPSYFRPGTLHKDDGITQDRPFHDGGDEWVLLDGTPASCTQIGLYYLFNDRGPIDLVLSGPNYGRNTTAIFALSSGTIGAAMEGATLGKRAIALSYAFDSREHDPEIIAAASKLSTRLVEKLMSEWPEDVHLYSINVPLREGLENQLVTYSDMIQNKWTSGSSFTVLPGNTGDADPNTEEIKIRDGEKSVDTVERPTRREHVTFKWSPNFADVKAASRAAGKGDGWHVLQGHVTVTPLRANFWHLPHYTGEIKLGDHNSSNMRSGINPPLAIVQYPEPYVQSLIIKALQDHGQFGFEIMEHDTELPVSGRPVVQFRAYEELDLDHAMQYTSSSLLCAYVIRKALIRKHYLSNTIAAWLTKHPTSILKDHFKASVHFELDYAEFLDDALIDAWDLHESMARNNSLQQQEHKEWWILKPGMSDGGNGIRLFSSVEELQHIFEAWDPPSDDEDEDEGTEAAPSDARSRDDGEAPMTSQLRHFIVQPYIDPPLLLPAYGNRKFHIRCYVLAVGALRVYVYREMLALFAAKSYETLPKSDHDSGSVDLSQHLTNTCFQDETTKESSVHRFWTLDEQDLNSAGKEKIYSQICEVTGEVFEAAAKEQMIHFQAIPNAFEIFGVDFLVDAGNKVWLLEMNAYPDFKQTGEGLRRKVVGGLFNEVVKVAVAPFFGATDHLDGCEQMTRVKEVDLGRR